MIRAKTCFLAEGVTTDRDTGQISAFRLIQNLRAAAYPISVPKIAFFCLWERDGADPSRARAEFSITLDGRDITRQPVDVDFGQHLMNCCTIWIADLGLAMPGHLVLRAAISGHQAAEWTLDAGIVPGASLPAPATSHHVYDFGPVSISNGNA
ncbi:MAG TPA: hypothetical protein VID74_02570 [Gemmatimonadales bacterium]|jgi:hypothetical protein